MNDSLNLHHFYYGNLFNKDTPKEAKRGQGIISTSLPVETTESMLKIAQRDWDLGNLDHEQRWRYFSSFRGTGFFSSPNGSAFAFLRNLPAELSDRDPYYLYHWVWIPRKDIIKLAGHWQVLTQSVRAHDEAWIADIESGKPIEPQLDPLKIQTPETDATLVQKLHQYFPAHQPERLSLLTQLLNLLLVEENTNRIGILGTPDNEELREDYVLALNALLPPALRSLITYSTRLVTEGNKKNILLFLNKDERAACTHFWNAETGEIEGYNPKTPVSKLSAELVEAYAQARLFQVHEDWAQRSHNLASADEKISSVTSKFSRWFELRENGSDSKAVTAQIWDLLETDSTLTNEELKTWFKWGLERLFADWQNALKQEKLYPRIQSLRNKIKEDDPFLEVLHGVSEQGSADLLIWLNHFRIRGGELKADIQQQFALQTLAKQLEAPNLNDAYSILIEFAKIEEITDWQKPLNMHWQILNHLSATTKQTRLEEYSFAFLMDVLEHLNSQDIERYVQKGKRWVENLEGVYRDLIGSNKSAYTIPVDGLSPRALETLIMYRYTKDDWECFDSDKLIQRISTISPLAQKNVLRWLAKYSLKLKLGSFLALILALLETDDIELPLKLFEEASDPQAVIKELPFGRLSSEKVEALWNAVGRLADESLRDWCAFHFFCLVSDEQFRSLPGIGLYIIRKLGADSPPVFEGNLINRKEARQRLWAYPQVFQREDAGRVLLDWGLRFHDRCLEIPDIHRAFLVFEDMLPLWNNEKLQALFNDGIFARQNRWDLNALEIFIKRYTKAEASKEKSFLSQFVDNAQAISDIKGIVPDGTLDGLIQHAHTTQRFLKALSRSKVKPDAIAKVLESMAREEKISPNALANLQNDMQEIAILLAELSEEYKQEYPLISRNQPKTAAEKLISNQQKPKSRLGLWYWMSGIIASHYRKGKS